MAQVEEADVPDPPEPEEKKRVASKGIPSESSFYLPSYTSPQIRPFLDTAGNPNRIIWDFSEVLNFVFPKQYQQAYNNAAVEFMKELEKKTVLTGADISEIAKKPGISKATLYNKVLPRLKRIGMIKVERDTIVALESKRKFRPMKISLSKTFGHFLNKIGDSYLALVDEARSRHHHQTRLEKQEEK